MNKCYRVIFQTYDESNPSKVVHEELITDSKITLPTNCLDFTVGIEKQLSVVGQIQGQFRMLAAWGLWPQ